MSQSAASQPAPSVAQQSQINAGIVALAGAELAKLWPNIDFASPAAQQAVKTFFGAIVAKYARASASTSAMFYDERRAVTPARGGFAATPADPIPQPVIDKIVESAWLGAPAAPEPAAPEPTPANATTSDLPLDQRVSERLTATAQRLVLQAGRDTIAQAAAKDPANPRYIRVPTSPKPCAFCVMLASRDLNDKFHGYKSARSALFRSDGEKYHTDCDCEPVAVFPGQDISEISPNMGDYLKLYNGARRAARRNADWAGLEWQQQTKLILKHMRLLMKDDGGTEPNGPKKPPAPKPPEPKPPAPKPKPAPKPPEPEPPAAPAGKPDWSAAQTAQQVGDMLQAKYPDLHILGFNNYYKTDIRAVREFAEAVDDMLTKYPQIALTQVDITKSSKKRLQRAYAWATPRDTGKGYMETSISLNATKAKDWDAYRASKEYGWSIGWTFPGDPDRPVYSTMIHELGHALDFAGGEAAHRQTTPVLQALYATISPNGAKASMAEYKDWLRQQMSTYSFKGGDKATGVPEPWEVLAEAFADVENNGAKASDTSKALHKLLIDSANTARGTNA